MAKGIAPAHPRRPPAPPSDSALAHGVALAKLSGAIWLRRHGDKVQVLTERNGKWYLLIEEFAEAPFSHIIEPAGIASRLADPGNISE